MTLDVLHAVLTVAHAQVLRTDVVAADTYQLEQLGDRRILELAEGVNVVGIGDLPGDPAALQAARLMDASALQLLVPTGFLLGIDVQRGPVIGDEGRIAVRDMAACILVLFG